jgi:predicted nucleic acid-binding protein
MSGDATDDGNSTDRTVLVDASVFITLTRVDLIGALLTEAGEIVVPKPVENEITSEPAATTLDSALENGTLETWDVGLAPLDTAASHLGKELSEEEVAGHGHATIEGDVGLLALALQRNDPDFEMATPIVVTDDKPLRQTCKALSIPVSGSIGVLIRAVERDEIEPAEAKDKLYAMDEVGARLSASLVRRAQRLIDEAVEK